MFEANPLAMIMKEAGGVTSFGSGSILDIKPREIHQRVPFFCGSKADIQLIERLMRREQK